MLPDGDDVGLRVWEGLDDPVGGIDDEGVDVGTIDSEAERDSRGLRVLTDADGEPLSERGWLGEPDPDTGALGERLANGDRELNSEADADGDPETSALELALRLLSTLELKGALLVAVNDAEAVNDFADDGRALALDEKERAAAFVNVAHTEYERVACVDTDEFTLALLAAEKLRVPATVGEMETEPREEAVEEREMLPVGEFPIVGRIVMVELGLVDTETDTRGEIDADVVPVDDGERDGLPETRGEAETLVVLVDVGDRVARPDTLALCVALAQAVPRAESVACGEAENAAVGERKSETDCVCVESGHTVDEKDGECEADADSVGDEEADGESECRGVSDADLDSFGLPDELGGALVRTLAVSEADSLADAVFSTLPVGDTVGLFEIRGENEALTDTMSERESCIEGERVGLAELEIVGVVVTVQLRDARPVIETDAVTDGEDDMDTDTDTGGDRDSVLDTDGEADERGERECDPLTETEGVHVRDGGEVALSRGERDTEGDLDDGMLRVIDAVEVKLVLSVDLGLSEDTCDPVTVPLGVSVKLGDDDDERERSDDRDADGLREIDCVADDEDERLGVRDTTLESVMGSVTDTVISIDAESGAERLCVEDILLDNAGEKLDDGDSIGDALTFAEKLVDGDTDGDADELRDRTTDGDGLPEPDVSMDPEGVTDGFVVAEARERDGREDGVPPSSETLGLPVCETVPPVDRDAALDGDAEDVSVALDEAELDGEEVDDGEPFAEATGVALSRADRL